MDPDRNPAIVLSWVDMPVRPRPDIWLALLVPVMHPLLKPSPNPSPRLETGLGPDETSGWEFGAAEIGVLGVGREGAVEAGRRGWLGGLGVGLEGREGFV